MSTPPQGLTSTNFAQMTAGRDKITQCGNDLRTHHTEAQSIVGGLATSWSAESQTTFISIMDQYDIEHQTMLQALEQIELSLELALGEQTKADDDTNLVMGQLRSVLDGN
ncbi:Proteins of 100 residues with WXG [Streptomyces sp. cf386]|uniref:WXG100 family type VII secretion target n=1 Tax=Streptomyces sp. cf386 TaxID=1761904 RepID=UPI0008912C7C|nr:WXG100 family type VII secretion target [Streptomyces sp. cf386]SDM43804.1 Proteins of 100 residues with WXG [Streptomyces sp. cf386]